MFWRRQKLADVTPGSVFHRVHAANLVELAEVEWVGADHAGIPHVRYQAKYQRPGLLEPQGTRLLALASFSERFVPHGAATASA